MVGFFFAFTTGGLAWFTNQPSLVQSLQYNNITNGAIIGIISVGVARVLSLTTTTFFLDAFYVIILTALGLLPFAYVLFPSAILEVITRFIRIVFLQGRFIPDLLIASLFTSLSIEILLYLGCLLGKLRYVPANLAKEFSDRFRLDEQHLLRGNVTKLFKDRILKRANEEGGLAITWVTNSATPELLKILAEPGNNIDKEYLSVISTPKNCNRIKMELKNAGWSNVKLYQIQTKYMSRPRFMIINGREVIRSMPVPGKGTEEPIPISRPSNIAYRSESPCDISQYSALFQTMLEIARPC